MWFYNLHSHLLVHTHSYTNIFVPFCVAGHEVVILKKGCRICGTGGSIASAPLVQSKSYFEVKIQQSGQWSIGLATNKSDLNASRGGKDGESWCLGSDNAVLHNGGEIHRLSLIPADTPCSLDNINGTLPGGGPTETGIPTEGDIIGVAFDHVELNFYLNGKKLDIPVLGVKGTVYPALFGIYISANSIHKRSNQVNQF